MAASQFIHVAGVPYRADAVWPPATLRRAFGHPLPPVLSTFQDPSGCVPIEAVSVYLDQLGRAALRAFDQHSEIVDSSH